MASKEKLKTISLVLFRLGQLILLSGCICFILGIASSSWVIRPLVDYTEQKVDPLKVDVIKHFGIFTACKQGIGETEIGDCGTMTSLINFVDDGAIRLVQAMMVIAGILYMSGFVLDFVQIMPITVLRNFLAENRIVEMLVSIATVLGLVAIVIYAGEVKNKAELIPGQEDEVVGWSFVSSIIGLSLSIIGLLLVTMFRNLPIVPPDSQQLKGGSWLR